MKAENGLKKCSKCGEVKGVEEFGRDMSRKDGLTHYCKECGRIVRNKFIESHEGYAKCQYQKNKNTLRLSSKKYREKNIDIIREKDRLRCRRYRLNNKNSLKLTRDISSFELSDNFVKMRINGYFGIKFNEISSEMIEIKRIQLINNRFIKKITDAKH